MHLTNLHAHFTSNNVSLNARNEEICKYTHINSDIIAISKKLFTDLPLQIKFNFIVTEHLFASQPKKITILLLIYDLMSI